MTVRWTVRAAEDRARSSRENRVPIKNVAKQHKAPRLLPLYPLLRAVTLPMRATHAEQLTLNLLFGGRHAELRNIPQAVCKGPGFESLEVHQIKEDSPCDYPFLFCLRFVT